MVLPVALGGATLAPGARRAPDHGGLARGARRAPVVSIRVPRRVAVRAAAETPGPAETDEQREARISAEAVRLVEYRLKKVLPAGMLDSIVIPPKLTEIRSFVRWEEAGKPENTSREWQVREYQAALVDLKLEMLAGGNLNDVRRRYSLDTEFGEDAPMHTPTVPELQLLKIAADIVKEREYYDPAKIAAIENAEAEALEAEKKASQDRIEKAKTVAKDLTRSETSEKKITEDLEAVRSLELAFETDVADIGAADAAAAVEEEDDLHARIAAAAEVMVAKTAEAAARSADAEAAKALELASLDGDAAFGLGAFGDDEIAVLKARLQQEAEIARDKARVKAEAAKRVKLQMEALAAKARKAKAEAQPQKAAPAPASEDVSEPALTPARKKQRELAAAKAAAEAQLTAAREEMVAAKAALEASAAKKAASSSVAGPALGSEARKPAEAKKNAMPEPTFPPPPVAAPAKAAPVAAKAPAPAPAPAAKAAAPPPTANAAAAYGVTRSATELEAKAAAKRLAAAKDAEREKTAALEARRERAAAEKRAAEAEVLAAKDAKRAASASAAAVAAAVDERVKALETLHAKHIETLVAEHEQALAAARAAAAAELSAELADSASSSERLLRSKLGEAVTALEVSNEQCKSLKAKLARGREELEKVKTITAKAAEVLESRSADQRLIKSLKRELDVAVELEAAAEARAAAAEKTASTLKKQIETPLGAKPASERIAELESDLKEANEILAEFKQSWEADRKVIALLSRMKDAQDASAADAAALSAAAAKAKDDSDLKSAGLWGLAKKYGKKTLEISSELWFGEGKNANAADVALRASAAKRNNTLAAAAAAAADEEDAYARVGGSATVARLRAKAANAGSDTKTRVRQMSWLAAADTAAEAAAAEEKKKAERVEAAKKAPAPRAPAETKAAEIVETAPEPPAKAPPAAVPVAAETQKNNAVPLTKVAAPAAPAAEPAVAAAAKPKPEPKAWGASAASAASAATPFTPSIVIPPASDDDETPKSSGWSSAHMPPGR